LKNILS